MRFTDPGGSEGKASACNAGDLSSIPGSGRSPGEEMATHSSTLAWKSHGWRSLVGYSPQGGKESDRTSLSLSPDGKGSFLKTDHKATFKDSWFVIIKQLNHFHWKHISVQSLSSVRLCDPTDRSTPGRPVHQQLSEFTQTHVH